MSKAVPISINDSFSQVQFLSNRTPKTTDEQAKDAFAKLADYRDGGVFIAHYAGNSEWERHANGDEIVFVVAGETTLFALADGDEVPNNLSAGEFFVVPQNTWHRFESPNGVKVMTVTPQPTDHSAERPV